MSHVYRSSSPLTKLTNVIANVRRRGFTDTLDLYRYRIYESFRDWQLGIRTQGYIEANELGHGADCIAYEAINYRCLDIAFRHLEPNRGDTFLDYGCGKGRAVVTAATYPFGRVIGVELSAKLSELARQNVGRAARRLQCSGIEIVTANAADFEVPDDVSIVFVFNPFTGRILDAVKEQMYASLRRSPRRMRVAYMHPAKEENALRDYDWLGKSFDLPTADWKEVRFMVYENREYAELSNEDRNGAFAI